MGYNPPPPPPRFPGVSSELALAATRAMMTGRREDVEEVSIVRAREQYVGGWLTFEELDARLDEILEGDLDPLPPRDPLK